MSPDCIAGVSIRKDTKMKKKLLNGLMTLILVVLIVALLALVWGNFSTTRDITLSLPDREMLPADGGIPTPTPTPTPENEDAQDEFPDDANITSMRLAVAGDIVAHSGLNQEALQEDGSYDYSKILGGSIGYLTKADYAVACLETTFPDTTNYTGYPQFASPSDMAKSFSAAGIDMLSTASNHCLDSYSAGLKRTLDILDENGIDHVGTYRTQEERDENSGIKVVEVNGITIAFLAFTYGTNGIPSNDDFAVNVFYTDYLTNLSDINYDLLKSDMAAARALETDIIAVWMHWGNEYYTEPIDVQYELADFMFEQGADLILGGHTHVPEPMELREVVDIDGNKKTGFICYSLGNFISCQNDRYTNLTAIVNIDIEKNLDTGETRISEVGYAPMFMVDLEDYGVYTDWRYRLWDLHGAIGAYEGGNDLGVINDKIYEALKTGLDDLYLVLDREMDMNA